ncbi:sigma-54 dependent transcriptionalregulator/response regulator FleR [Mizugakiibacter sediminis]|uniref:Sigma-54 dependent transcriptionalregulator/response regulator FleR n=1 Tax=Mizugakiibacter sediminis TaxID=1475481 RepID=A0A0K8QK87_9GAMM|nr:sigma-54 dependent transcriptional regulator [Mizugakiibacter sediminis]GAP65258.1 sigma-54 dependent transcriptionalregulator/response regulator FleR [Mizugakiibacter sediminis]
MNEPCVLIVEDDADLREALRETLELAAVPVAEAADGERALALLAERPVGLVVSDVQMWPLDGRALLKRLRHAHPHVPVVMMTAFATVAQAVEAMREGAADYLVKPFDAAQLVRLARRHLHDAGGSAEDPVAVDPRSRELLALARRVAASEATVLIGGDSGTGKEVYARAIHAHSPRAAGPFVAINCAAIPENMLEAVLFGHEKGAYTGAQAAHAGKFEQAQGGTLLLDEISEMGLGLQAKLLRVLQEREVERLGGRAPIALDVRVIATSNRRLREEVAAGRFREDLFYRLNVFPLHLPPLRERPGDILPLARRLLARHCRGRAGPALDAAAEARLLAHRWPGNVRELDNLLLRALVLAAGDTLGVDALRFESDEIPTPAAAADGATALDSTLRRSEQALIFEALRAGNGSRKAAAERLGISPRTLRHKLQRLRESGVALPVGTACASL